MSIKVLISCEVDLADLPLEDHAIDVIASVDMNLEYKVPISFTKGEDPVLWALPENCSPGGDDEWEIDGFDVEWVACDIASLASPGLSTYELYKFIQYIVADITTYLESDNFHELAIEKGLEANAEEPDEY